MKKTCENCAKRETCSKDIGNLFGFCNTDFEPILPITEEKQEVEQ